MADITLNQITSTIKISKQKNGENINTNKFMQTHDIPINMVETKQENIETTDKTVTHNESILKFVKDDIIEIPEYFSDFLDLNKFYIYGCNNYLESITLILDSNYKTMSDIEKKENIQKFNSFLMDNLNNQYKKLNYHNLKIKKSDILDNLKTNLFNKIILKYISDILNINILLINLKNKLYNEYKCSDIDTCKNNIILLEYEQHILPLINIYNDAFVYKDLQKIKVNFKEYKCLDKISNYTLNDLQQLAGDNNISIYSNNINGKKKLKTALYNEINHKYKN